MSSANSVFNELSKLADPLRAQSNAWFFKTGPGEYGEGDKFISVTVPQIRKVTKEFYKQLSLKQVIQSLHSPWHEERLAALFMLVLKYQKGNEQQKTEVVNCYLANTKFVNNWDLVDSSAPYILGDWLLARDKEILYTLCKSEILWERRISVITTLMFIRKGEFGDTMDLAEQLLYDKEDLIHKAVGWCLREVGKKVEDLLEDFLNKYAATMPRTTLRYAIEKFPETKRRYYLKLK